MNVIYCRTVVWANGPTLVTVEDLIDIANWKATSADALEAAIQVPMDEIDLYKFHKLVHKTKTLSDAPEAQLTAHAMPTYTTVKISGLIIIYKSVYIRTCINLK